MTLSRAATGAAADVAARPSARKGRIALSMGSKGDCYDNAVCANFHASLEKNLLRRRSLRTRQEARTAVEAFYDRERVRSTLGYRSLEEYEQDC